MKKRLLLFTLLVGFSLTSLASYAAYSEDYEVIDSLFMLPSETVDGGMNVNISGRNVVNILSDDGNCEDIDVLLKSIRCTTEVESERFKHVTTDTTRPVVRFDINEIDISKYYLLTVDIDNDTSFAMMSRLLSTGGKVIGGTLIQKVESGETDTVMRKFQPSDLESITDGYCYVDIYSYESSCEIDEVFYSDNWLLCEITEDEYNNLSADELLEKYTYVSDTQSTTDLRIKNVGVNFLSDNVIYNMSNAVCHDGNVNLVNNSLVYTTTDNDGWTKTLGWNIIPDDRKQYTICIEPNSTIYYSREINGLTNGTSDEYVFMIAITILLKVYNAMLQMAL